MSGKPTTPAITDVSWNCATGCTKVSPGCRFCSVEREWSRLAGNEQGVYHGRLFNQVACHPERLEQPLHWVKPRIIAVNSHSDTFHESISDEFIDQMFAVMVLAGQHQYLILTKREARMKAYLSAPGRSQKILHQVRHLQANGGSGFNGHVFSGSELQWPLPNVWVGVSVEDQASADRRIPVLMNTPGIIRFVACEPLIGAIDLRMDRYEEAVERDGSGSVLTTRRRALDWVVLGCESGPQRRKLDIDWVRSLRAQCNLSTTPFYLKQLFHTKLRKVEENPLLDGSRWMQYPKAYVEQLELQRSA